VHLDSIYSLKKRFATRVVGDERVVVPVTGHIAKMNELFTLNATGSFIWDQIDGRRSEEEIVAALVSEVGVEHGEAAADLAGFLEELSQLMNRS
jgi:hypothetical protein